MFIFPNYIFLYENSFKTLFDNKEDSNLSEYILDHLLFITKQKNFVADFNEKISNSINLDLLGYLYATLPSIIFSKIQPDKLILSSKYFEQSSSIVSFSKMRIDLLEIEKKLNELESNKCVFSVDKKAILSEIVAYVFRLTFVNITISLNYTESNKLFKEDFIKSNYDYNAELKKVEHILEYDINDFFKNKQSEKTLKEFLFSFDNRFDKKRLNFNKKTDKNILDNAQDDINFKRELIDTLKSFYFVGYQKKYLNSVFNDSIIFKKESSKKVQNRVLSYFYINLIFKFFKQGESMDNDDGSYDVIRAVSKFRKKFS